VRHRLFDRGAAGERGLTTAARSDAAREWPSGADVLVRPALELALAVARAGEREQPPVPAPRALRPVLGFTRLPATALDAARRVLDDDEAFRGRVAEAASEEELGRVAWLFLVRPEGWWGALVEQAAAAEAEAATAREERAERSARLQLGRAQAAARRAEEARAGAQDDAARARRDLVVETRARRAAEAEAEGLRRRAGSLEGERDSARRRADEATAEAARLREEVGRLEEELTRRDHEGAELERRQAVARDDAAAERAAPSVPPLAAVAGAVREAAEAAAHLAAALAAASEALAGGRGAAGHESTQAAEQGTAGGPRGDTSTVAEAAVSGPGSTTKGRIPLVLPPAIFEDSAEAAEYLVRAPGLVVVVDGYNASLWAWPELPIAEQRRRLVDALGELAARTGSTIQVVFDGMDGAEPAPAPSQRSRVQTRFSSGTAEADDVILRLVEETPPHRAVLVASNDRRVQREARRRGANVITASQLFAVLRREV
jgi:predicted RNA-binding protein with PIN domain